MKIAIDVHYKAENTKIVAALFDEWTDSEVKQFLVKYSGIAAAYIPGEFYKRELPCLLEILKDIDLSSVDCIIVDGFVYLDNDLKPGLGAYLYLELLENIPIMGVAKSNFLKNKNCSIEILRGESVKPLYVTAAGMELNQAAENIEKMHGDFRMPTLLQQLDTQTKEP